MCNSYELGMMRDAELENLLREITDELELRDRPIRLQMRLEAVDVI
tara:strand:+ start:294 stop:431 length:138 start_codon:yes stop_codon:yes gene_type:complete